MRILRFCTALLLVGGLASQLHAAPAAKTKAKKKSVKIVTRTDTLMVKSVDTLTVKSVDTLKVKDVEGLARLDSLVGALGRSEALRTAADSQLVQARLRESALGKVLDSTKRVSNDLSILLARQKDSLRTLDSLRRAHAPDSNLVLFLPISYDSVRHPKDSTLARALTRNLLSSAIAGKRFEVWTPKGKEQGCNQPECWSAIARRKGAGQILTGTLAYSGDTLIYSSFMTSLVTGQVTRQSLVVGYHRESDPAPRFSRMAASQLFGVKDEVVEDKHVDSPLWRRVMLLGVFGIFAGTVTALSW